MQDSFWGLAARPPNRSNLQPGDRVVFYWGIPERVFAGTAIVDSPSYQLSEPERERVSHNNSPVFDTESGIRLRDIEVWAEPQFVPERVEALHFIENQHIFKVEYVASRIGMMN